MENHAKTTLSSYEFAGHANYKKRDLMQLLKYNICSIELWMRKRLINMISEAKTTNHLKFQYDQEKQNINILNVSVVLAM